MSRPEMAQQIASAIQRTLPNLGYYYNPKSYFNAAKTYHPDPVPYARELKNLFEVEPTLPYESVKGFEELINTFNRLVEYKSPCFDLLSHARVIRDTLLKYTKQETLPSLEELQQHYPEGELVSNGLKNAVRFIEIGTLIAHENQEGRGEQIPPRFKKIQIMGPSKKGLSPHTRSTSAIDHIMERILLEYMKKFNYFGAKDTFLGGFEEIIMYMRFLKSPSILDADITELGYITQERFDPIKKALTEAILNEREVGKTYISQINKGRYLYKRILSQADMEEAQKESIAFTKLRPIAIVEEGPYTFCLHRNDMWEKKNSYGGYGSYGPYYTLETLTEKREGNEPKIICTPLTGEEPNYETTQFIVSSETGMPKILETGAFGGRGKFNPSQINKDNLMEKVNRAIIKDTLKPESI